MKTALHTAFRAATDPGQEPTHAQRMPQPLQMPLGALQSLSLLAARVFLAQAFFLSGLTKIRDWGTTLALFENEYAVPLLPPNVAAVLGTGAELVLPLLLLLGLGGRFAAAGLFILNIVAVVSLMDIAPAALQQHQFWGALLFGLWMWGPGRLSLDRLFFNRSA